MKTNNRIVMKKILIICTLLALIVGCASPRKCFENHPAKKLHQLDILPGKKENRFTKQFRQADSMFNKKYRLHED
nr:MAG TPA: Prokaryotic membrane lipoprotein lipid attachment site [Caudoviricetes sp.]